MFIFSKKKTIHSLDMQSPSFIYNFSFKQKLYLWVLTRDNDYYEFTIYIQFIHDLFCLKFVFISNKFPNST